MAEARYRSLNDAVRERFGEKLYKLTLNAGCSCPNRDGKLGTRGCIFCSAGARLCPCRSRSRTPRRASPESGR